MGRGPVEYGGGLLFHFLIFLMLLLSLLFLDVMLQSISGHNINLDVKTNETFFFNIHNESTHLHV